MKIGFIGVGNMGGALLRAVLKKNRAEDIYIADSSREKTDKYSSEYGVKVCDNTTLARECGCIFLGVKPQMMEKMLVGISGALAMRTDKPLLITMAAGLGTGYISFLAGGCDVVRIMPNMAVGAGEGMILVCAAEGTEHGRIETVKELLSCAGKTDEIPESLIDAASALTGCGPAYVCMFVQALADGAVECGVPRASARMYALQTVLGTVKTLEQTGTHPEKLKDDVCSPAGTTIAGVHALEDGAFRNAVMNSVTAAYKRTLKMKK